MIHSIPRALAVAALGGLVAPACLVLAYALNPETKFAIDRLPPVATGFYTAEREGQRSYVWTAPRATVVLAGLDRTARWSCSVAFRGARPADLPQPDVTLAVDGVFGTVRRATNDIQEMTVTAPERPATPGLALTITTSDPFLPGNGDDRALGVQVDRLACRPVQSAVVLPPRRSLGAAVLAGVVFGAALGLTGITAGSAVGGVAAIAAAQAVPLSTGTAPYGAYPGTLVLVAAWLAFLMVVAIGLFEAWNGERLRNTARFAVVFSALAVYLKLLSLLHPSKAIVDAVFHAHRFESVLGGRYYFTQLSTSATPFPYAIGLYLFAVPWSALTHDHVALLRIVVCACEAVAGGLLYLMVVRTWGDRLAGAIAVALFSFVPISYVIVGYANLTNAFGASAALAAMAAVTLTSLEPRRVLQFTVVVLLAALALISHISTFLLLLATLATLAVFYRVLGTPDLHARAGRLLLATAVALVLSVALYWGHFGAVYQAQIARMRGPDAPAITMVAPAGATAAATASANGAEPARTVRGRTTIPLVGRVGEALSQTAANIGWPILVLALLGTWQLLTGGGRDRLVLAISAWAAVCVTFVTASVVAPADARYQQDAWEFIARVEHMTAPAAVLLAAVGAAWAWRASPATRLASAALMLAALFICARLWVGWLS